MVIFHSYVSLPKGNRFNNNIIAIMIKMMILLYFLLMDNPLSGCFWDIGFFSQTWPWLPWSHNSLVILSAFQNMLSREAKQKSDSRDSRADFDVSVEW